MVDPNLILIGAAIGGAAGKFVEKALDLGEKWISSYFKDHAPKAREQAQQNYVDFLNRLADRVSKLEQQDKAYQKIIKESLDQPGFSVVLQKAILSSAQTDDEGKHEILARLVADRLTQDTEDPLTLCSKQAADVVPSLSNTQLKTLGFLTTVIFIKPDLSDFDPMDYKTIYEEVALKTYYENWLAANLTVYQDLEVRPFDYLHLEALSCIRWDPGRRHKLNWCLTKKINANREFDADEFLKTSLGSKIDDLWTKGLKDALPTSIGLVIGIHASECLSGIEAYYIDFSE